jgi:hypothetical protein
MMKVRLLNMLMVVSFAAAVSGCVSYGNTHALITPVGVAGYHTFKPSNAPRDVPLPPPAPDQMASVNEQAEPVDVQE